jgi:GMP synthase (glutamine-hydrolysing)
MKPPVLIVLHQQNSTPGRVGHYLVKRGYPLDIRKPCIGDPLPDTLARHSGAIVFGGPQSANDNDDYVLREIDWMAVPLKENKPLLGICLGAQMMARNLGGKVSYHDEGQVEVGYYPIRPTQAGREISEMWPDHVYQWHREGFDLPVDSVLLAEGDTFPCQAFRHGDHAFGVQFHPEVTHAMMCRWLIRGQHRMELPGAKQRLAHFEDRWVHDYSMQSWLSGFLDHWLRHMRDAAHDGQTTKTHQAG